MEHKKEHNEHHEHTVHHSSDVKPKRSSKLIIWQIIAGILLIGLIASIVTSGFKFSTTKESTIKENTIKELTPAEVTKKATDYINANVLKGQGTAKIDSITEANGMYAVKLNVNGQSYDSYVSKDGQFLFPSALNLNEAPAAQTPTQTTPAPTNMAKSDKPKVEVFVMSHCPYGTQIEKGVLPVAKLLGDKINFEIKWVYYAMHGEKEVNEQLKQYCIQRDFNDKYFAYLSAFLEAGDSAKSSTTAGITDSDLSACIKETDAKFKITETLNDPNKAGWVGQFPPMNIHLTENKAYGVQGSPTLVINGAQVQAGRDAKSLLAAICNAFNTKPAECNTDMTSYGNPGAGFGYGTQGSASAAGCGV